MNDRDLYAIPRGAAAGGTPPPADLPDFLRRREPEAIYSYDSCGRLTVVKGDDAVCLSPGDLDGLRRFVWRVAGLD